MICCGCGSMNSSVSSGWYERDGRRRCRRRQKRRNGGVFWGVGGQDDKRVRRSGKGSVVAHSGWRCVNSIVSNGHCETSQS